MALNYHRQFLNRKIDVLVERTKDGWAQGYSQHYIPVQFQTTENLQGQVVSLKAIEASATNLICE
jgi:hypothetical protein